MDSVYCQEQFFLTLLNQRSKNSKRDIQRYINLDSKTADMLQSFNYDPYFNYREYIENQDVINRSACFIWWYLEGYYFNKGDINTGQDYTFKLCKTLKLNTSKVCNIIFDNLGIN